MLISTIILFLIFGYTCSGESNKFEATIGCSQYNTDHGYNYQHPYFSTGRFQNIQISKDKVIQIRLGVLGYNDGHIRLAQVMFPYNNTEMNEIVLSGWANTKTVVRRYTRDQPNSTTNLKVLKEQASNGMLSHFAPFMFTMMIHPGGLVQLTRDDDSVPFLEFYDAKLLAKYIGFCNWDRPLVFFYDCPLEVDRRRCEGIAFN
ncbi:uncharacterized protein LOC129725674 [Wyeomyia smithii]|uniref:uncharacterized protein LOC129725674 n=1 Tax=Wyeomyia smithii TaxID=174621 RepID=UPI0024680A9A|nr:uncharacterized protein LOC129725674 [Wyeomyia smithii]